MAEAYWDLEWALQQQGFDYCYDKRLYDRLVARRRRGGARAPDGRRRLPAAARPLHREPRRAACGGDVPAGEGARRGRGDARPRPARGSSTRGSSRAGACSCPSSSRRRPDEAPDAELRAFYERLLGGARATASSATATGSSASAAAGTGNDTLAEPRRLGLARRRAAQARRREPRRRAAPPATSRCRGTTCAAGAGGSTTRSSGDGLRAQRRRPPRRALRRARPVGVAPLRPDTTRLRED